MRTRSRAGFTLVELMVAMALTVFIMVILSQIFVVSLETFSGMKGIGDMQSNMRVAETLLREDLKQSTFEGRRRLSDVDNTGQPMIVLQPPQEGFFAIRQVSAVQPPSMANAAYYLEGFDVDGMPSYRAYDHFLHFSVRRKGNRPENFFTAALIGDPTTALGPFFGKQSGYNLNPLTDLPSATVTPPYQGGTIGYFGSQWAEVVYFLIPQGTTEEAENPTGSGTKTFKLYRAQFLMMQDGTNLNTVFTTTATPAYPAAAIDSLAKTTFSGLACRAMPPAAPTALQFYSAADAANGQRVVDLNNPATLDSRMLAAATLVLPNVISFHVQAMPLGASNVTFQDLPLYDTARFGTPGYPNVGLRGLQITLRVWDQKTSQTRQVTIIQDL